MTRRSARRLGRADAKIIVRIDHSAFVRHTEPGETCEIAGIGPVPVSVVEEWMDDAFIAAILTEGEDVTKVVHLGPPRQRRRPPSPNRLTPPPTRPPGRGNGRATPRLSGRAGPGDGSGIAVDGLAHIDAGHLGIGQEVVRPSSVSAPTTSFSSR